MKQPMTHIRVTAYAEDNGGFVPGAYYVFESSQRGASGWREVITFRHDEPNPIPRHQIVFLDNKIGSFSWDGCTL